MPKFIMMPKFKKQFSKKLSSTKAFTLVELLVVIIIIGILAAVAIPAFLNQRQRANDAAVQSDIKGIATSIETFLINNPQGAISRSGDGKSIVSGSLTEPVATTKGVNWDVYGSASGYCISAWHDNGDSFTSFSNPLTYNSSSGGILPRGQSCGSVPNSPNGTVISSGGGASEATTYAWTGAAGFSTSTATTISTGVIRTNYAINPSSETSITNWGYAVGSGTATYTRTTTGGASGNGFYRITMTSDQSVAMGGSYYSFNNISAGETYTSTTSVRSSKSQPIKAGYEFFNSSSVRIGSTNGPTNTVAANTWTKISVTGTVPPGTAYIAITFYTSTGNVWKTGDTFDSDALLIEKTSTAGSYFDGYTTSTS